MRRDVFQRMVVLLFDDMLRVVAPFGEAGAEVIGEGCLEMEVLAGGWVVETQYHGMKCLSRQEREAVFDKLLVAAEGSALEDAVATISGIVEEGVAYMLHMGAYLVRATCFEDALDQRDISETLYDIPMGDGMFAAVGLGGDMHDAAILWGAFEVAYDGAPVVVEIAPYQGAVFALYGMLEELLGQDDLGGFVLGH